jgi:hypothetical protein
MNGATAKEGDDAPATKLVPTAKVVRVRLLLVAVFLAQYGSPASAVEAARQLTVKPSDPVLIKGLTLGFRAFLEGGNDGEESGFWTSSNPAVATIDGSGRALALSPGTTTITASTRGGAASTTLTIIAIARPIFLIQPGTTPVGAAITPGVTVLIQDDRGSPVADLTVTVSLGTDAAANGGSAALRGTLSRKTHESGTAHFPDLRLDWLGQGYTIVATVTTPTGPLSSTSAPFDETRVGDACLGPAPACSSGCPDADGDGLNDAWERAGGIDFNGDGRIDEEHDLLLPGADPERPDVYVQYDWMDYGGTDNACGVDADCGVYRGQVGATCTGPAVPGSAHSCAFSCTTDAQCTARGPSSTTAGHIGERCVANICLHTHDPEVVQPGAIQAVVDSFAAHGINLHVLRGHAMPHSHVLSFRQLNDLQDWCEGGSLASSTAGRGLYVESFYDLKAVGFDSLKAAAYHYAVFSHHTSCDSPAHCNACPATGKIPGPPAFGGSGLAEIDGNDFMVSTGRLTNDIGVRPTIFNWGGTFMHELGHNLGLRHGGGSDFEGTAEDTPLFKPNFLSVMNYKFQLLGIQRAIAAGSIVPAACSKDADCHRGEHCTSPSGSNGVCSRLDYSTQVLPSGGNTPGRLTEDSTTGPGLNEPAGLGSGTADLTSFDDGTCGYGFQPSDGPLDYDGDGNTSGTNVSADLNRQDHPGILVCPTGVTETLDGHTDWGPAPGQSIFNYSFQCTPFASDGLQPVPRGAQNRPTAGAGPLRSWSQDELTAEMAAQAHALYPAIAVRIVVRPGCTRKALAPGQPGVVGVSVLGEADFDVSEIEPSSLRLHGAQALSVSAQDVDGSGRPGVYATFEMKDLKVRPDATTLRLTGWLKNSQFFIGESEITAVPRMWPTYANCQ